MSITQDSPHSIMWMNVLMSPHHFKTMSSEQYTIEQLEIMESLKLNHFNSTGYRN